MARSPRRVVNDPEGFTLIEVVVAMALFAILTIGMLGLLDTSTKVANLEQSLSDTQENVRFAAYHLERTVRMTGGAGMPFAGPVAGAPSWLGGRVLSNQSGFVATSYPLGNIEVLDGTDVVTVRGFFEIPPLFIDKTAVDTGLGRIEIEEFQSGRVINSGIDLVQVDQLAGRGLVFMGELNMGEYVVGQVGVGSTLDGEDPDRTLTVAISDSPATWWTTLNATGTATMPSFEVYQVGVLDSYTYFVDPQERLMRLRADGSSDGASLQPVAVNIGGLQVSVGVDTDDDGNVDSWMSSPTAVDLSGQRVVAMRIAVLGRTPVEVPGWVEPQATFEVGQDTQSADAGALRAKWRRVDVVATLRNYMF